LAPLSPHQRTDLLAGGITASLALSFAALLVGYWWSHRPQSTASLEAVDLQTPSAQPLANSPLSNGRTSDDVSYILGHRWWRKAPSRARLHQIVTFVIEQNRGGAVIVDDIVRLGTAEEYQAGDIERAESGHPAQLVDQARP
jgi:hypothetical protein